MNQHFLALWLWLLAWCALSVAAAAVYSGIRGHGIRRAAAGASAFLFLAAVLANAGADLW